MEYLSNTVFYHNALIDWIISGVIILIFLLVAKLIFWLSKTVFFKLTQKTKNNLDNIIQEKAEGPIVLGVILIGIWIALHRLHFSERIDTLISDAYQILIILNVTWFIVRIIDGLIKEYLQPFSEKTGKLDSNVVRILKRTISGIIWIFGVAVALSNIGINIGAIITGLGIGGIAFALAAQDTIKNIFAGVVIFIDRPFRIGDNIKIDNYSGTVVDIGLRSVRIRTYDKRLLTMSCSKVVDAVIENITSEPGRRIQLPLGLTYDTTPQQMDLALSILKKMPTFIPDIKSDVSAFFTTYGDSSLNIMFIYFIRKGSNIQETQSNVNLEILKQFNGNGLNFAFPTTTVYLEK